jgi:uridylate kinase
MKFVISLGGSVIVPDEVAVDYLKEFKRMIEGFVSKGYRFVILCGGGSIARKYQTAAKALGVNDVSLDWVGISATKVNAELVRSVFKLKRFYSDPNEIGSEKITVMSGWKPGCSTDYDAVLAAKKIKADMIINVTDVKYVYDKDPKKFPDAKPLKEISWKQMSKTIDMKWKPGMNTPFDPVATRNASGLKVVITGKDIKNLKNVISGEKFEGTLIS